MRQLRESLSGSESLAADSEIRESNLRSRNIRASVSLPRRDAPSRRPCARSAITGGGNVGMVGQMKLVGYRGNRVEL